MGSGAHGGDDHGHGHSQAPEGDDHAHGHGHSHGGSGGGGGDGEGTTTATPFVKTDTNDGVIYYQAPDGRVLHSHDGCVRM